MNFNEEQAETLDTELTTKLLDLIEPYTNKYLGNPMISIALMKVFVIHSLPLSGERFEILLSWFLEFREKMKNSINNEEK